MSVWKQWVKKKLIEQEFGDDSDPGSKFKFDQQDDDFADDYDHVQSELFKTVLSKYPEETMAFLNNIADRGDEEIGELLRKMQKEKGPSQAKEPSHPSEKDEVMPASADTGFNPEFDGGGQ